MYLTRLLRVFTETCIDKLQERERLVCLALIRLLKWWLRPFHQGDVNIQLIFLGNNFSIYMCKKINTCKKLKKGEETSVLIFMF